MEAAVDKEHKAGRAELRLAAEMSETYYRQAAHHHHLGLVKIAKKKMRALRWRVRRGIRYEVQQQS